MPQNIIFCGGLIFLFFFIMLWALPDGCNHDYSNIYQSGCHTARFYGITCTPGQDCWNHWPHDHSPGNNGILLMFFIFGILLIFIFCWPFEPDVPPVHIDYNNNRRKRRVVVYRPPVSYENNKRQKNNSTVYGYPMR